MVMQAYAIWVVKELPEQLDEIYISAGVGEEQHDGFFVTDKKATLSIERVADTYLVTLKAPSNGLEKQEGYWLSPSQWGRAPESKSFGIKNLKRGV